MGAKRKLLTTGYAGHDPDSFLGKLQEHDVDVVVDVRQNPVSRKRGFSRTKLSEFLTDHGIEYTHLPELGVPANLRHRLRDGECDLDEYFTDFREYLQTQDNVLDELYTMAARKSCCLICVEHLPDDCHRSVVADVVASRNEHRIEILHV
jgi:uncharacterized protein (DUF488 family)